MVAPNPRQRPARLARWLRLLPLLPLLALAAWAGSAAAHPSVDRLVRVVHFEPRADGLAAYVRLSLPLLPASGGIGYDSVDSGRLFHYLDAVAAREKSREVGRLLADSHRLGVAGRAVAPRVVSLRIWRRGHVPPFATLDQARLAPHADLEAMPAPGAAPVETRYVLIDAELLYPVAENAQDYPPLSFSSMVGADGDGLADTANLLFFHGAGTVRTYSASGALASPVPLNPSLAGAARMFVLAGCRHILEGWDHLLFVLCLVLGQLRVQAIALRITGFSIGHSLSLGAGLFGAMPAGAWFSPWIEVAIALSLLGAALAALWPQRRAGLLTVALVGLVHGFGLAFGLRALLADSSAPALATLLFFNLGVEAGQLLIAGAAWLALCALRAWRAGWTCALERAVAMGCATVSLFWLAERLAAALSVSLAP